MMKFNRLLYFSAKFISTKRIMKIMLMMISYNLLVNNYIINLLINMILMIIIMIMIIIITNNNYL